MQSANSRPRGKRSTTRDSPARSTRSGVPELCGTAPSSAGARMFPRGCSSPRSKKIRATSARARATVSGSPASRNGEPGSVMGCGCQHAGHGAHRLAGPRGGLADAGELRRLLALARGEDQRVAGHPDPPFGGQHRAGPGDHARGAMAGQRHPPGLQPAELQRLPHHPGEERRRFRELAGQAGDVEIVGSQEGEAGRRRLFPLHQGHEAEAGLAPAGEHQEALPQMGVPGQKGREVRVLRRRREDEQGLAAQLVEPGRERVETGPHRLYMLRSMNFSKAGLGAAPIMRSAILPSLNRMKVGMLDTWN